ncbi:MAG TPA: MarR family transcriptional regulator [Rhodospirillaceae bacterium]|jgi:DNA-binding MarR family transcriptional regulator|nr:winged helix-turn-helix transcriptional regulator [Alphaproteobacteria bacterium]HBH26916.1 MarR family transcriptional regulator [Rhodospirillaceae bacterium]
MSAYYEAVQRIERLHRSFLDVLKAELDRASVQDINNVQAMILYNIGADDLTVGELTARGYYLGSNVSYNVKKMVEAGYLEQERSQHDKRSVRVRASDKGRGLVERVEGMIARHEEALADSRVTPEALDTLNATLGRLERFWGRQSGGAL